MRKLLWTMLVALVLVSCKETPQETVDRLNREITLLENMKAMHTKEAEKTRQNMSSLSAESSRMESVLKKQKEEYKTTIHKMREAEEKHDMKVHPDKYMYIIKLRIHQTTYTLSVGEYIKNKINDVEFEIPVDKNYYNKCRKGQVINDPSLKIGSLIFDGDFSKYKVTIANKRIAKR